MSHKIRLGPVAVFLSVVAVVLTTLAVLTIATSNADKVMAERFAKVTQIRYELENEGEKYLMAIDEAVAPGAAGSASSGKSGKSSGIGKSGKSAGSNTGPASLAQSLGAEVTDNNTIRKVIEKDGYELTIEITEPDGAGNYDISTWKITKKWNAEDPFGNIWQGGN